MKRPEGFDRPDEPAVPAARPAARPGSRGPLRAPARTGTTTAPRPSDATRLPSDRAARPSDAARASEPAVVDDERPASRPDRVARPPRTRSPEKEAAALLKAAQRARRREEQREVRRFTRGARRRRAAWISSGLVVLALVGILAAAVFSPLLALRHIRIEGASRLDATQLERAVDGQLGTPLALLDRDRITRELRPFSLIRSYSTEIVPPDTMVVHIVERTPVGVLEADGGFQLVDPAGVPVAESQGRPDGVPLIQLPAGKGVDGPAFAAMSEVLLALPPELLARVDTISATTPDDVRFVLRGGTQTVVWGTADDSAAKARTLAAMPEYRAGSAGTFTVTSSTTAIFLAG
jgi:cell division protein FtsQ